MPPDQDRRSAPAPDAIAAEIDALRGTGRQITPFTARDPAFDLDAAYRVIAATRRLREARGERPVGRKIGFTNRRMWAEYGVDAPIWGHVYDTTLHALADVAGGFPLAGFAEPQIEPEIAFGLAAAPAPEMDAAALLACIGWVAHGFEIVQSIYPGWRFGAADTVASNGLHGALLLGPRHAVAGREAEWLHALGGFEVELLRGGAAVIDRGHATAVLDGPLHALRHLVGVLARDPANPPLVAGEVVTTGSLTRAHRIAPGDVWSTRLTGIPIDGIRLRFV